MQSKLVSQTEFDAIKGGSSSITYHTSFPDPRKTERYRRIPCKARGLPERHNPQTAYIDIPPNAPHGLLLACSNEECSASGRRFRYCTVCRCPVAKRNFHRRHAHGIARSRYPIKEDCIPLEMVSDNMQSIRGVASTSTDDLSIAKIANTTEKQSSFTTEENNVVASNTVIGSRSIDYNVKQMDFEPDMEEVKTSAKRSYEPVIETDTAKGGCCRLTTEERRWLKLFRSRPSDEASQAAWVDNIVTHGADFQQQYPQQAAATLVTPHEDVKQPPTTLSSVVNESIHQDTIFQQATSQQTAFQQCDRDQILQSRHPYSSQQSPRNLQQKRQELLLIQQQQETSSIQVQQQNSYHPHERFPSYTYYDGFSNCNNNAAENHPQNHPLSNTIRSWSDFSQLEDDDVLLDSS